MINTLITDDRLQELVRLCRTTPEKYPICEVGVYKGGSLKTLADNFPERKVYGVDSFEGLPEEYWTKDEIHKPGEFSDSSLEEVKKFVNNENVIFVQTLFPSAKLKPRKFSFVHLDIDFYKAIRDSLDWFVPKMAEGGVIVLDDYEWPACPGVAKALKKYTHYKTNAQWQAYLQF